MVDELYSSIIITIISAFEKTYRYLSKYNNYKMCMNLSSMPEYLFRCFEIVKH